MIYIDNLTKTVGTRVLFDIEKLIIDDNDKIALIGDNGSGKSSFLKILSGLDFEYTGNIEIETTIDYLLNDEKEELKINDEVYSRAKLKYGENYSPGEYQRLRLINILYNKLTFIFMDEPTSHLDIKQKNILIENLKNRRKGFVVISHDRDFINKTCNKIFELINGKLEVFNGNYSFYLEEKEKRNKFIKKEYESYISEKKRLLELSSKIKEQSEKVRTTPKRMGNSEARLHKMGGQGNKKKLDKQVKAVESRINQLEIKERPKEEASIDLTALEKDKIYSKVLIKSEKLNKKFSDKIIFENANLIIENNSKVALLGDNGSGKSTLLNMIINKELWVHPNLKIGYYSQLSEILDFGKSILDNILESSIYDETKTRIILARLGFKTDDVFKFVDVLSDGEKAKVKLAKLLTSDFNYLIMDEPTNFLDIRAIEALEKLLESYDRPLLFVTHDISFINNIGNSLLIIENNKILSFKGNLNQYKEKKEQLSKKTKEDDFLIDFRLTSINNKLAMEISKEERIKLEEEYENLIRRKKSN